MIIGNGLVASKFREYDSYDTCVIFSSGVSNSQESCPKKFNREKSLVSKTLDRHKNLQFIYFSTILVNFSDTKYNKHKLEIENLIKDTASSYIIFRVPQLIGHGGNKNNLVNFLLNSIQTGQDIVIGKAVERSILCVEDLVKIVNYCKDRCDRTTINISGVEKKKVVDICKDVASILGVVPNINTSTETNHFNWGTTNSAIVEESFADLGIVSKNYTKKVLLKYLEVRV
tara:strand:+ start:169 stop:855 length:687 start_codon:yes stop_codon:yes gene_type:complete